MKNTFAELFKRYRLRAEFEKLSELGDALAEKDLFYEDSIFSHWQKGSRVPHDRKIILKLIETFVERKSILSLQEANEFLESTGLGYLTEKELEQFPILSNKRTIFQVPNNVMHFTGRQQLIHRLSRQAKQKGIFLIHGQPGIGKTSLAIRLGHILSDDFSDGVLWYKVTASRIMDILLSIAAAFGEDISAIEDVEIRASIVRSLLSDKKVLLILDSAEDQKNLHLLLPNNNSCLTIITSRNSFLKISQAYEDISLESFTGDEVLQLFATLFGKNFINQHKQSILSIGEKVGNLPLAVHMLAKQLHQSQQPITTFLKRLDKESIALTTLSYEDKNLYLAIQLSYNLLAQTEKKVFASLAVFEGKDFSIDAVAYINNLSLEETEKALNTITNLSLLEASSQSRYRIHSMIKQFAKETTTDITIYLQAAKYYEKLVTENAKRKNFQEIIKQEGDSIIAIFNQCYQLSFWDEVTRLWHLIEKYLDAPKYQIKFQPIIETIDTKTEINIFQKMLIVTFVLNCFFWIFLQSNHLTISIWNYIYPTTFTITSLSGGGIGFFLAKTWSPMKSTLGKAILFISLGLFVWGIGNMIWDYYNFFQNVSIPYPSFADAGFFLSYPFWAIGMIYLSSATGVSFGLKKKMGKIFLFIIPIFVIIISYYLLINVRHKELFTENKIFSLKSFLNFAYPTFDVIILTLALIIIGISFRFFGGKYKISLYSLLSGFALMYIADFMFSFTNSNNTYYNGSLTDLLLTIALSFMAFGIFGFYKKGNFEINNIQNYN